MPKISNPVQYPKEVGIKRRPNSYRQDKQNPPPWPEYFYPITKNVKNTKRRPSIPATKYMMSPIFPQKLEDNSSQDRSPLSKQSTEVCSSLYHSPMRDSAETEEGKNSSSGLSLVLGSKNRPSSYGAHARN